MTVIADSSFIYSLFSRHDKFHTDAVAFSLTNTAEFLLPGVVLPEVSYVFRRDFGYSGVREFLKRLQSIDTKFVPVTNEDLPRMFEIAET